MHRTLTSSWLHRRSLFNHDWLKNKFLPALVKWLNILDDRVEDPDFERSFVQSVLSQWEAHREEALFLCDHFREALSPRRLLDEPPLARLDAGWKATLSSLVHQLWLARYPVLRWEDEMREAVRAIDETYGVIQQRLAEPGRPRTVDGLRPIRDDFSALLDRCRQLARAVGAFPTQILVT